MIPIPPDGPTLLIDMGKGSVSYLLGSGKFKETTTLKEARFTAPFSVEDVAGSADTSLKSF